MRMIQDPQEMQDLAKALRRTGKTIGFVPTMGFLHEGHQSLMRIARARCDVLVVSIFVNPAQFGPNEDYGSYPRDFERDERLCCESGVDFLFYPTPVSMYLDGHSVWVDEQVLSNTLCGAARPGHFRGVCTVVAKLLNLVLPEFMVLGEKDAQQLRVLRRMVLDLNIPVEIVSGPTVREPDGLAMSSRNKYLTPQERQDAVALSQGLKQAQELFASGERDVTRLKSAISTIISETSGVVDYIDVVDNETLRPFRGFGDCALVALAVKFSNARLIDNAVLKKMR